MLIWRGSSLKTRQTFAEDIRSMRNVVCWTVYCTVLCLLRTELSCFDPEKYLFVDGQKCNSPQLWDPSALRHLMKDQDGGIARV